MFSKLPQKLSQCHLCTAVSYHLPWTVFPSSVSFLMLLWGYIDLPYASRLCQASASSDLPQTRQFHEYSPQGQLAPPNHCVFTALGQLGTAPLAPFFPLRGHTTELFGPHDLALLDFIPKGVHPSGTHKLSRAQQRAGSINYHTPDPDTAPV